MAVASLLNEPLTDDDFGLPLISVRLRDSFDRIVANNPELRIESTANGEIVFMAPTGGESGAVNSEITASLVIWTRTHGGVAFDSSTLFRLPNGARRSPDASWIQVNRWQNLTKKQREEYPPICPDFVIELRSRSDRVVDLQSKMQEYIDCGVRLGWLIDPFQQQIHIYKPGQMPLVLQKPDSVSDDFVLPGFVLDLRRVFQV